MTEVSVVGLPDLPKNVREAEAAGLAHHLRGKGKESVESIGNILSSTKDISKWPPSHRARLYLNRAEALRRLQRHDECIRDCETAISLDPLLSACALTLKGQALGHLLRFDDAARVLNKVATCSWSTFSEVENACSILAWVRGKTELSVRQAVAQSLCSTYSVLGATEAIRQRVAVEESDGEEDVGEGEEAEEEEKDENKKEVGGTSSTHNNNGPSNSTPKQKQSNKEAATTKKTKTKKKKKKTIRTREEMVKEIFSQLESDSKPQSDVYNWGSKTTSSSSPSPSHSSASSNGSGSNGKGKGKKKRKKNKGRNGSHRRLSDVREEKKDREASNVNGQGNGHREDDGKKKERSTDSIPLALSVFQQEVESDTSLHLSLRDGDLVEKAVVFLNMGCYDKAISLCEYILSQHPHHIRTLLCRGSAYALLGQHSQAISDFTRVIEEDDTVSDAWKRRGQTQAARRQYRSGIRDLTKALEASTLFKKDQSVLMHRGALLLKMQQNERARMDFSKAVVAEPRNRMAWFYFGVSARRTGNREESAKAFEEAVSLDPSFVDGWVELGRCYLQMGRGRKALATVARALAVSPSSVEAVMLQSEAFMSMGQSLSALHALEKASRVADSSHLSLVLSRKAVCLHRVGELQAAMASYSSSASESCWYFQHILMVEASLLDEPFAQFSLDSHLSSRFKAAFIYKEKVEENSRVEELLGTTPPSMPFPSDVDVRKCPPALSSAVGTIVTTLQPFAISNRDRRLGEVHNRTVSTASFLAVAQMAQSLAVWCNEGSDSKRCVFCSCYCGLFSLSLSFSFLHISLSLSLLISFLISFSIHTCIYILNPPLC